MPTEFKVRAATGRDAEAIAALAGELGYPCDLKTVRERLRGILARDVQDIAYAAGTGWRSAYRCEGRGP